MLTSSRVLNLSIESGRPLPRVEALAPLYEAGTTIRHGDVVMIAGRSGSQKSGFALWYLDEVGLPTLYFSGDMRPFTAGARLASKRLGMTTDEIEAAFKGGADTDAITEAMDASSHITFSFGSPIRWRRIEGELQAYLEIWNRYPDIICIDNLMDIEGCHSDYVAQMEAMQSLTELARETGATVIIMHHASDKSWNAKTDPWAPPGRDEIKNGLSEKSEVTLSVALDSNTLDFNIATVKQRMGRQDPTGKRWVTMRCVPEYTRFEPRQPRIRAIHGAH